MPSLTRIAKDWLIRSSPVWDPVYIGLYRIGHGYRGPIPTLVNRRRVASANIGRFLEAGHRIHATLRDALRRHRPAPLATAQMLDFGAGVGRVLARFEPECPQLWATDVDASAVDYLRRAFPRVRTSVNKFDPPLPFAADSFDVVYSVSIWTHLPPDNQLAWLAEIRRVLRPGGLALLTTSGFAALRVRRHRDPEWAGVTDDALAQQGFIYIEYPGFQANDQLQTPGIERSYGLAAHAPAYVQREWARHFEVLEIAEGVIDNVQDLVVLRKPAPVARG